MMLRDDLQGKIQEVKEESLTANGRLVLGRLACIIVVLLTASALDKYPGLLTCVAALAVIPIVSIKAISDSCRLVKEVGWGTLALVAGLLVMVDAVESIGASRYTVDALRAAGKLLLIPGAKSSLRAAHLRCP